MNILYFHVRRGQAEPPIMIEDLFEGVGHGEFEDVSNG